MDSSRSSTKNNKNIFRTALISFHKRSVCHYLLIDLLYVFTQDESAGFPHDKTVFKEKEVRD